MEMEMEVRWNNDERKSSVVSGKPIIDFDIYFRVENSSVAFVRRTSLINIAAATAAYDDDDDDHDEPIVVVVVVVVSTSAGVLTN
ncbi:Hypothetical predicted protein [Octopus vulgaris]|uniref:Uncharacterized protein n=1 Tax=Octopus vulgaris TaxID=6645 RepID=A0AA36ASZ7_OCTVU|nr:Hypothetical predicted protein [Octopus vulgaris]